MSAQDVIRIAKSQIGYHEGKSGNNWNNIQKYSPAVPGLEWSQGQAWCATFISWLAVQTKQTKLFPITASTDTAASWYQKNKRWSEYPAIGAQGFLAHGTDEFHTFLVTDYDDTYIYTVEGNTNNNGSSQGDGVYALKRKRTDPLVEGYGYPKYPEGIKNADPAHKDWNPKETTTPVTTPAKPNKVTQARALLEAALVVLSKDPVKYKKRIAKIKAGLAALPKK